MYLNDGEIMAKKAKKKDGLTCFEVISFEEFEALERKASFRHIKWLLTNCDVRFQEIALMRIPELSLKDRKRLIPLLVDLSLNHQDPNIYCKAQKRLAEIGKYAVPELILRIDGKNDSKFSRLTDIFEMIGSEAVDPLIDFIRASDNYNSKICGVIALGRIGNPAQKAIPLLIEMLNDMEFMMDDGVIRYALYKINKRE